MEKRNTYIDMIRGVAAIGVISIHTAFWGGQGYTPLWFQTLTLLIDVPLFFFLSGWGSSYRESDVVKASKGLMEIWKKWVYFITVLAVFCLFLSHFKFNVAGVVDLKDLLKNYMFEVSFNGFPVVGGSIWFMQYYFLVIFFNTLILTILQKSHRADELKKWYCILILAVFVWVSYGRYFFNIDSWFIFYSFFWMLGYNRKYIKIESHKIFFRGIICIGLGVLFFSYIQGLSLSEMQMAKFPPSLMYGFFSLVTIFLVMYLEPFCIKHNKLLVHIGQNAIFYYFGQGIGSSVNMWIVPQIEIENWFAKFLITLTCNILITGLIAEFLAWTYRQLSLDIKSIRSRSGEAMKKICKKSCLIFMSVYCVFMIMYCTLNEPVAWGEYDDYVLPAVSIMNEGDFSINENDIQASKKIFPEWAEIIDSYGLSGHIARDGSGELAWYFPTYSIASIPFIFLLDCLALPTIYAFAFTNIVAIMALLFVVYKYLRGNESKKLLSLFLLGINPVIFYMGWISAEVFMFAFIGMAMIFWYNGWYKRAAVFISIAGTLNPTIMIVGIVMIFDYLLKIIKLKKKEETYIEFAKNNFLRVFSYGMCYLIGLVPLIYNYYNTGHINLTASYDTFTQSRESTLARMKAYFTDLNYGYLPYYGVILIFAIILLVMAIKRKKWNYILWIIAFSLNVYLYSIMIHINCGMSGMARYSVWASAILLLGVVLHYDEILTAKAALVTSKVVMLVGVGIVGLIIYMYGPYYASNLTAGFTPIAKYALNNYPAIYNPLYSTFNARVNKLDGGYTYDTPIVYVNENGEVKKILAKASDKEELRNTYAVIKGKEQWFSNQLEQLTDEERYISIPNDIYVTKCLTYDVGTDICFAENGYNATDYVISGISGKESWGSWTDSHELKLCMQLSGVSSETLNGKIVAGVYNGSQHVLIYVNDKKVYDDTYFGGELNFDFTAPEGVCEIRIELPDAIAGIPSDGRILGLSIGHIIISNISPYKVGTDICFAEEGYNAADYVISGISGKESWGSWTNGHELKLCMQLSGVSSEILTGKIIAGVYNGNQHVLIYVNDEKVYDDIYFGGELSFNFLAPKEICEIRIELPDAIEGVPSDGRKLGLSIGHIVINN